MNSKYLYTLLTLIMALYFVPVNAQTKSNAKKPPAKVTHKKKAVKTTVGQQKANAKSLGEAAAKTNPDTTKKGKGASNNGISGSLSEEIVVYNRL